MTAQPCGRAIKTPIARRMQPPDAAAPRQLEHAKRRTLQRNGSSSRRIGELGGNPHLAVGSKRQAAGCDRNAVALDRDKLRPHRLKTRTSDDVEIAGARLAQNESARTQAFTLVSSPITAAEIVAG